MTSRRLMYMLDRVRPRRQTSVCILQYVGFSIKSRTALRIYDYMVSLANNRGGAIKDGAGLAGGHHTDHELNGMGLRGYDLMAVDEWIEHSPSL